MKISNQCVKQDSLSNNDWGHCWCRLMWHYPMPVDKPFEAEATTTCCKCGEQKEGEIQVANLVAGAWVNGAD